jgi:hypothetical protein
VVARKSTNEYQIEIGAWCRGKSIHHRIMSWEEIGCFTAFISPVILY